MTALTLGEVQGLTDRQKKLKGPISQRGGPKRKMANRSTKNEQKKTKCRGNWKGRFGGGLGSKSGGSKQVAKNGVEQHKQEKRGGSKQGGLRRTMDQAPSEQLVVLESPSRNQKKIAKTSASRV